MDFTHLHLHSHYSLLDGLTRLDDLVERVKEKGMKAVALTDHGNLYGAIEFYKKAKAGGVKPIIGEEMYVAPRTRFDRTPKLDENPFHLILLAKNLQGYKNLLKLTSLAHLEGFYYKPRVDFELLAKHSEGLIALSGCLQGQISQAILSKRNGEAEEIAKKYLEIFGDRLFFEVQYHKNISEQNVVNEGIKALAKKFGGSLVATKDSHYLSRDDAEAQDVMLCLQTKHKKDDPARMSMMQDDFSFEVEEMMEHFKDTPEAIENTIRIADMTNLELEFGHPLFPVFQVPQGFTSMTYLTHLCEEGLKSRYPKGTEEAKKRLEYELDVISKTGFASYFLIVWDLIRWSREHGILTGPGRGSAAGSIVSYLLRITDLDPIAYRLVFERFLNPERISLPDIDLDFPDTRRAEVLQYVEEKYGKDHVAQIVTFGTMAARVSVRDVGRVLGSPYAFCDSLAKMIPPMSDLKEAVAQNHELHALYETNEEAKKIIDTSLKLEGVARHASTHACGVVIAPTPLDEYVPLQYASTSDRTVISQYEMHAVDDLGLLKIDFLGLKNLTLLENTKKMIQATTGAPAKELSFDDKKTIALLQKAETTGVFQLESNGMKKYLRQLKTSSLEDIIAMVALYRPGPVELIPEFIAGKHGKRKPTYLHPALKPILEGTHGIAVYQEQVLQIARDLAGFSYGQADILRKAIGKKIPKLLMEQKVKFMEGCLTKGVKREIAEKVFAFIEPFAGYSFNRAHAACYAYIAWQTAFLKANYPTEFMACLLTMDSGDLDRVGALIEEAKGMGLEVLPPDINESFADFTAIPNSNRIRFGLKAIKNLGEKIVDDILAEREKAGPFADLESLLTRMKDNGLNKKSLESLIKAGALEKFGERALFLYNVPILLAFGEKKNAAPTSQLSLFTSSSLPLSKKRLDLKSTPPATKPERLAWEKEVLGLYLSDHPFSEFLTSLKNRVPMKTLKQDLPSDKNRITIAGIITGIRKVFTRKGEPMIFARLEDESDYLETVVFPKVFQTNGSLFKEGNPVRLLGRAESTEEGIKFFPEKGELLRI